MTNPEIMEKALTKAMKNGYSGILPIYYTLGGKKVTVAEPLIYNHDFAKALWDDKIIDYKNMTDDELVTHADLNSRTDWQYHLQQMVIADDPIKYLGDNI